MNLTRNDYTYLKAHCYNILKVKFCYTLMNRLISLIALMLILLLQSCDTKKTTKLDIPVITPEYFVNKAFSLSYIADDVEYIPLDSKVLFRHYMSVQFDDSLFFLSTSPKGVLVFNKEGKYLRQIGRRGRGPGEYTHGNKITLDKDNHRLYVNDLRKILIFNYKGSLIREFSIDTEFNSHRLYYLNNKLIGIKGLSFSMNYQPYNWFLFDTLGNILFKKSNSIKRTATKNIMRGGFGNFSYLYNDKIHYWNHFNDTVFELNNKDYRARYLFKKDKYRITPEVTSDMDVFFGKTKHLLLQGIFENNNNLYLLYRRNGNTQFCIYDKIEHTFINTIIYSPVNREESYKRGLINDIDGGVPFLPNPISIFNMNGREYLIKQINACDFIDYVNGKEFKNAKPKYPEKKKTLIKLANSLDEKDNPVLMLVRLKK